MGKKKKLKKRVGSRLEKGESALVVCVGKDCAPRERSRAVVDFARAYVRDLEARVGSPVPLRVAVFGCLGVCKKGPVAATLPDVAIYKRVDERRARELMDGMLGAERGVDAMPGTAGP